MTREEIDKLWPEFTEWWTKKREFRYCPEKQGLIDWWYRFLEDKEQKRLSAWSKRLKRVKYK